ncbi:MAG: hypothetical protein HRU18_11085 [Pseudoalteromonas sp.]|uniref:hypothetical protein n=1 Tax=Pseudoalteromonas sp. TaxID=53249 RepID=UPI001DB921E3|nr:hypothetical protein [Pseudoalteromonas sp.]NRA78743.1 hypothetical protein [Pseudoalteromonas sp.]
MSDNKEYKPNIRVINLSTYEKPVIEEQYNKDWVKFGQDNDYYDKLVDRHLESATNARCIDGIGDMIYGRGLDSLNSEKFPEDYVKFKKLLKKNDVKRISYEYYYMGQAAMQITYNKTKTKILKVSHFPIMTLRAAKAVKGVIKKYYYHPDWKNCKSSDKPKPIPSFGNGNRKELNEIYIIKPYSPSFYYYAPAFYHSCLQYAELEGEVSEYHISNIQNGLAPSLFINFNNGTPNEETQRLIENKINEKFSGSSNAGRAIIAFNDSQETKATIDAIHLPDAHAQYQFLSDESREKIMLGHGIVSPILLGIKDNTGFGNNAEELRTASILMDNVIIRPRQDELISAFKEILEFNGINQELYFITLQPIEFTELDNISTKIRKEEETGEKLSAVELDDFSDEDGDDMLDQLEGLGEVLSDDWELIHSEIYQDEKESVKMAEIKYSDKASREDDDVYKVRYAYMPVRKNPNSRKFCKKMEALTEKKVVFRKEDINMMSFRGVNKELGHKQRSYSLLKYKGGKNCHHYWELRVYKKKGGQRVSEDKAYQSGLNEPNNPSEMTVRPTDMPNGGAYPSLSAIKKFFGI